MANLRENGASAEEIEFLQTSRVELNAMASDEFVAFIERKLDEVGVKKIIPEAATLEDAWQRGQLRYALSKTIGELKERATKEVQAMPKPADLSSQVAAILEESPE